MRGYEIRPKVSVVGLIPHWAKDESIGYKMINARAETITEKPAYRGLLPSKRCIVPASGFYEWQDTGGERNCFCWLPCGLRFADCGPQVPAFIQPETTGSGTAASGRSI